MEVNAAKTRLSFDMVVGGVMLPRNEYVTPDGRRFVKWCGLLINAVTLNVQVKCCSRHAWRDNPVKRG